jgi:hypothetical protein
VQLLKNFQHFTETEGHCHVHKRPPLELALSQINPVHNTLSYISMLYFNIIHPPTSWSCIVLFVFYKFYNCCCCCRAARLRCIRLPGPTTALLYATGVYPVCTGAAVIGRKSGYTPEDGSRHRVTSGCI